VDEYVRRLQGVVSRAAEGDDPSEGSVGQRFAEETPRLFDVVLRGYDRKEVDGYLERFNR
jgi:hypothetical protein